MRRRPDPRWRSPAGRLAPLYLMLKVSFSPPAEVMTAHPTFLPHGLTWDHWHALLATGQVLAPLAKSLTTATLVAMAAVAIGGAGRAQPGPSPGALAVRYSARPVRIPDAAGGEYRPSRGGGVSAMGLAGHGRRPRDGPPHPGAAGGGVGTDRNLCGHSPRGGGGRGPRRVLLVANAVVRDHPAGPSRPRRCRALAWVFSWEEFILASYLTLGAKTMPLQVYYYLYQGNWFLTAAAATTHDGAGSVADGNASAPRADRPAGRGGALTGTGTEARVRRDEVLAHTEVLIHRGARNRAIGRRDVTRRIRRHGAAAAPKGSA